MAESKRFDLVLAVEIDLAQSPPPPEPLDRSAAEQLGIRLSADLGDLLPGIQRLGLVLVGALYDTTRILAAGRPVFETLADIDARRPARSHSGARVITIGAREGDLGSPVLNDRGAAGGALLLLPLAVLGEDAGDFAREAESVFLDRGQVGPPTAMALQKAFGVTIPHARFMTLNDLSALLRLQLEHAGLAGLWELLDSALFAAAGEAWVVTDDGNAFALDEGRVDVLIQAFDHWATVGGGAAREDLEDGYAGYLRQLRQYLLALEAHGLAMALFAVDGELPPDAPSWRSRREGLTALESPVLRHLAREGPGEGPRRVTVHAGNELGAMAYTVEWVDVEGRVVRREHLVPLKPEGLDAIQRELRDGDGELELAWSQGLCIDVERRCLVGDPDLAEHPPVWH